MTMFNRSSLPIAESAKYAQLIASVNRENNGAT